MPDRRNRSIRRPSIVVMALGAATLAALPQTGVLVSGPIQATSVPIAQAGPRLAELLTAAVPATAAERAARPPGSEGIRINPVAFRARTPASPGASTATPAGPAGPLAPGTTRPTDQPRITTTARPGTAAAAAIDFALAQRGLPYIWGGNGPQQGDAGFDCSGLTTAAYDYAGVDLPRTAHTQYYAGPHLPSGAELQPGDLVFYGVPQRVHHVGLYIGEGRMVAAPTFGKPVRISYVRYTGDDYLGATRPAAGRDAGDLDEGLLATPDLPVEVPPTPDLTVPAAPEEFAAPEVPAQDLPPAPDAAPTDGPPAAETDTDPEGDEARPADETDATRSDDESDGSDDDEPDESDESDDEGDEGDDESGSDDTSGTDDGEILAAGPTGDAIAEAGTTTRGAAVPSSTSPETDEPETDEPETNAPETNAPETSAPETATPETATPETATPETAAPEASGMETSAPETSAPETTTPEATTPPAGEPETSEAPTTEPTPAGTDNEVAPDLSAARPVSVTLPGGAELALSGVDRDEDGLPAAPAERSGGGLRFSPAEENRAARAVVTLHADADAGALEPGAVIVLRGEDGTTTELTVRSRETVDTGTAVDLASGRGDSTRLVLLLADPDTGDVLVVIAE